MLNTMVYYLEFPDGSIREYRSNVIYKNMYSQVDSEGFSHSVLSGILDFVKDATAVHKGDQYIITKSGQRLIQKSTVGWNLLISWKYASNSGYHYQLWKNLIPLKSPNLPLTMVSLMNPPLHRGSHTPPGKSMKLFLLSIPGWNEQHTNMVWPFLAQLK